MAAWTGSSQVGGRRLRVFCQRMAIERQGWVPNLVHGVHPVSRRAVLFVNLDARIWWREV
jgi:hypothetical protein